MLLCTASTSYCVPSSQVRNLRSSIKVALDFVTPCAVAECLTLRDEWR